jgi:hypothetical protein
MRENSRSQPSTIEAGQIWLIEQQAATGLCPLDRGAVTGANVVLYDRALAPMVAAVLPIGSYAEALPHNAQGAISPRALAFAADGWSVVQLTEPCAGRRALLQGAARTLVPLGGADDLPVQVIAKGADGHGRSGRGCLPGLAELIGELGDDDPFTLVLGPLASRSPVHSQAFTANGLAG